MVKTMFPPAAKRGEYHERSHTKNLQRFADVDALRRHPAADGRSAGAGGNGEQKFCLLCIETICFYAQLFLSKNRAKYR